MDNSGYRAQLEVDELLGELRTLQARQRNADRLICRYLADLEDGLSRWPFLVLAYGDACELARRTLDLSQRAIRERIRVGRALRRLPALEAALASGALSYSRAREVTRVAEPVSDRWWLHLARTSSMRQLEKRVSAIGAKPAPEKKPRLGGDAPHSGAGPVMRALEKVLPREVYGLVTSALRQVRGSTTEPLNEVQAFSAVLEAALRELGVGGKSVVGAERAGATDQIGNVENVELDEPLDQRDGCGYPHVTQSGSDRGDCDEHGGDGRQSTQSGSSVSSKAEHGAVPPRSTQHESSVAGWLEHVDDEVLATQPVPPGSPTTQPAPPGSPTKQPVPPGSPTSSDRLVDSGSRGARLRSSLSQDALLLFDLVRSGGVWTLATLCEATQLSASRAACGLTELEMTKCVVRDWCGVLQPRMDAADAAG